MNGSKAWRKAIISAWRSLRSKEWRQICKQTISEFKEVCVSPAAHKKVNNVKFERMRLVRSKRGFMKGDKEKYNA